MNDKKEGHGTYYYDNGESYVGEFKAGKRNGKGIFYGVDGSKEAREYKDGVKIK